MSKLSKGALGWIPLALFAAALGPDLQAREPQRLSSGQDLPSVSTRGTATQGSAVAEEAASPIVQEPDDKPKIDQTKIYYGNPNAWTRAAVVKGLTVIKATPAYKEMRRKGVRKDDPAYELYTTRAKEEAKEAIESAAQKYSPAYDLVGEVGAIVIPGRVVPNITETVLRELAD